MIDNAGTTRLMDPYGKVPKVVNLEVLASKVNDEYSYIQQNSLKKETNSHGTLMAKSNSTSRSIPIPIMKTKP